MKKKMCEGIKIKILMDGRKYSIRESRMRIFTPKEWILFMDSLKDKNKPFFDCLINTGGRCNEVRHLKKKDINFNKSFLTFKKTKSRNPFTDGKPRSIKLSSQYLERLKKYCYKLEPKEYLFQVTNAGQNQLLKRRLKKIRIKDYYNFSLHNIRKTSECWLNFLGSNHLLLLKHFGHNQTTALKHYLNTFIYDSNYKFQCRQILGDLYM